MAKYLVIVESPSKIKTIKKVLGSNYEIAASNGHIRDLPKSTLGIDVNNNFEPKYITIRGKGDKLAELKRKVKKSDKVYIATDPDREGEAIAWHLAEALKLDSSKMQRISFNEITKSAIKDSLKHPRDIDTNLVDAQQARRVLDRMVGYGISPVLWSKVKRGLSAGRVQSVALRMICDREQEINDFISEEYWSLGAVFNVSGEKKPLKAMFYGDESKKTEIGSKEQLDDILEEIKNVEYKIKEIKTGERVKKPPFPFTTSTLQQEASKLLNFSTQKTMRTAQQLYEGVDISGRGTIGLITYLRTDSVRVADEADSAAKEYIRKNYGEEFVAADDNAKKKTGKIQDAHEAVRPTDITLEPAAVKDDLTRDQFRLYQLIWKRFAASRMAGARYATGSVKIKAGRYIFTASASKPIFEGFMSLYNSDEEDEKSENGFDFAGLDGKSKISVRGFEPKQHFTQPPAHYTEAALVKALEEQGIGRPSTYATTITTIINRRYVVKESKNLYVTETGEAVNNIMKIAFPEIVDLNFTANLEALLDGIGDGEINWKSVVGNFYPDLEEAVSNAGKSLEKIDIADEETDEICDMCGRHMVVKYGPYGKFLACPGFPECKNTKPYLEKIGAPCPKCGKDAVLKKTKKGRKYYGCIDNPECDFMSWQKPLSEKCPGCGAYMVEKGNKAVCSNEQCGHVKDL